MSLPDLLYPIFKTKRNAPWLQFMLIDIPIILSPISVERVKSGSGWRIWKTKVYVQLNRLNAAGSMYLWHLSSLLSYCATQRFGSGWQNEMKNFMSLKS